MSRHFWYTTTLCLFIFAGACLWQSVYASLPAETPEPTLPRRQVIVPAGARRAVFAAGCFWGVQEALRTVPGVVDTKAGYTGGQTAYPTYESIHASRSGHVEAVEVTYDPSVVRFEHLVEVFLAKHNPTLPDRKGQAMGKQFRSFIFYGDTNQKATARDVITRLTHSRKYSGAPKPIVTQVRSAETFWPAEEQHQFYYQKRSMTPACVL
jgi:methionine-S-sulfoxide reductase